MCFQNTPAVLHRGMLEEKVKRGRALLEREGLRESSGVLGVFTLARRTSALFFPLRSK